MNNEEILNNLLNQLDVYTDFFGFIHQCWEGNYYLVIHKKHAKINNFGVTFCQLYFHMNENDELVLVQETGINPKYNTRDIVYINMSLGEPDIKKVVDIMKLYISEGRGNDVYDNLFMKELLNKI